jgi:predicted dithiol-disulfide oxidoreductase (DUF899 family)
MALPPIVSTEAWQAARDELLLKEKAATRALDALAAERRRLPMVRMDDRYALERHDGGAARLVDLFEGRRQLLVYHFMLSPGSDDVCGGCAAFTDNIPRLEHLAARDTTLVLMSRAPRSQIVPVRERMGWTLPWYSSYDTGLHEELGIARGERDAFGLSVFLRDGEDVYRTYFTQSRGVDRLRMDFNLLDLTPLGRQEEWEDSPEGWPQTPPYQWWRLHDEY